MEAIAGRCRADMSGTDHELAEPLGWFALRRIVSEYRGERGYNGIAVDVTTIQLVHPRPVEGAAEIQVVYARCAANQADLRQIGAGAAIRASGHSDRYVVLRQAGLFQLMLQA